MRHSNRSGVMDEIYLIECVVDGERHLGIMDDGGRVYVFRRPPAAPAPAPAHGVPHRPLRTPSAARFRGSSPRCAYRCVVATFSGGREARR